MAAIDTYINAIVEQGRHEARQDGSTTIEAHHLLLAIAGEPDVPTGAVLTAVGLDRAAVRAALDREYEQSLNAAGVSLAGLDLPRSSRRPEATTVGASARLALERGFACVGRKRDLRPGHLLLGILQAQVGTVPRALAVAGIDRADLTARLQQALAAG